jgi:hypothetical protein
MAATARAGEMVSSTIAHGLSPAAPAPSFAQTQTQTQISARVVKTFAPYCGR